jgi:methylmalonyl-CoA/ethylmalonyl-CoA epimerase
MGSPLITQLILTGHFCKLLETDKDSMEDTNSTALESSVDQIGIVVHDLYSMIANLSKVLGIGPFRVMEWPLEGVDPQATYHGKPGNYRLLLAFATIGKTQLEIIQPLEGPNIYSDFLDEHGPGLHHIRLTVPDFEDKVAYLEGSGIDNIASGTGVHVGSKWAYFDTSELLEGVVVELRKRLDGSGGEGTWIVKD